MAVGSACPSREEPYTEIRGRDLVSGLLKTVVFSGRGGPARDHRDPSAPSWTSSRTHARPVPA